MHLQSSARIVAPLVLEAIKRALGDLSNIDLVLEAKYYYVRGINNFNLVLEAKYSCGARPRRTTQMTSLKYSNVYEHDKHYGFDSLQTVRSGQDIEAFAEARLEASR